MGPVLINAQIQMVGSNGFNTKVTHKISVGEKITF
jgi:hypothetical protein